MANISTLKKFVGFRFSSGGVIGPDFKSFSTKLRNYIKAICEENNMEMVSFNRGHYECSGFVKVLATDSYFYWSISDVRYWSDEWFNKVLYRTATGPKDYRGGQNMYCPLEKLGSSIVALAKRTVSYNINGKTFNDMQMRNIGRDIASLWGAECYDYTVDKVNQKVIFDCIEHGEKFVTEQAFNEF